MLHFEQVNVGYGYVFGLCVFQILRTSSEVLCLWGAIRILVKVSRTGPKKVNVNAEIFFPAALWFVAIYNVGMLFSLGLSWLAAADLNVINNVAKGRYSFDAGYTAIQFLSTLVVVSFAYAKYYGAGGFKSLCYKVRSVFSRRGLPAETTDRKTSSFGSCLPLLR